MKDALAKIIVEKVQVYGGQVLNAVDVAQAVMEYKPDEKMTIEEIIHAWEMCEADARDLDKLFDLESDEKHLCNKCLNEGCKDDICYNADATLDDVGRVVRCSEFTGRNE